MVESYMPNTYEEVLEILSRQEVILMAGGTNLMVKNRMPRTILPKFELPVLFLRDVDGLKCVEKEASSIHIGSMSTLHSLLNQKETPDLLKKAIQSMATPAIRNSATIGGCIATASPTSDLLPVLYLLNAKIVLESTEGVRTVKIEDLITGPGTIECNSNEIIKKIIVEDISFDYTQYEKIGSRRANSISKLTFCGAIKAQNERIIDIRVAFGACGPTVIRNKRLENKFLGKSFGSRGYLLSLSKEYIQLISPDDDPITSVTYRKKCAQNLLKAFLGNAMDLNVKNL